MSSGTVASFRRLLAAVGITQPFKLLPISSRTSTRLDIYTRISIHIFAPHIRISPYIQRLHITKIAQITNNKRKMTGTTSDTRQEATEASTSKNEASAQTTPSLSAREHRIYNRMAQGMNLYVSTHNRPYTKMTKFSRVCV